MINLVLNFNWGHFIFKLLCLIKFKRKLIHLLNWTRHNHFMVNKSHGSHFYGKLQNLKNNHFN